MNTTKILCETFDWDERGYFTIGDVFKTSFIASIILLLIGIYLHGMYQFIFTDCTPLYTATTLSWDGFTLAFAYAINIILGVFILCRMFLFIKDIKVLSCGKK